ncbi:hypothetical protein [Parachryseolinea silvisoli]|jgi:hypothetical protein|uniref:hypothetical protein n=1 Tax=Parachryseolinea silvisoli TaxID=2873601 RepID=UPI002265C100|nr:hypothetical protein [Parachryseolinea silvisoli]MCD9016617.1 hypothetical protein [Parachryseolinea silvisoli]
MEIFGFVLMEIIFTGVGWACLHVWYRDRKKVEEIKNEEYAGEYSSVGRVMVLNLIAGIGALTMFGMVIFLLVTWIYEAVAN